MHVGYNQQKNKKTHHQSSTIDMKMLLVYF